MPTILFAYEFGAGQGHLNRLVAVAKRLDGSGHRLVFALPDLGLGRPTLARAFGEAAEIRQGIVWPGPSDPRARQVPTHTFADVIRLFGFADPARLVAGVRGWRDILGDIRPDLIVADFAPTLRLAVADTMPFVMVGNGYTIPPPGRVLPPMRPWETIVPARSRAAEGELLAAVNRVRAEESGPAIDHFADLFGGARSFVCTFPEFDPYGAYRTEPALSPFNVPAIAAGPPPAERRGPAVFAYLPADHPALPSVLTALNGLEEIVQVYVPGIAPTDLAKRCRGHIAISTKPVDYGQVLPQARLLVHHGGLGTSYAGLVAGTPQLVLPVNLEHLLTARGLAASGTATVIPASQATDESVGTALRTMLPDTRLADRALDGAKRVARLRDADPLRVVAEACQDMLSASGKSN